MKRKGVGILAGIVVVLLGALLATPALIDWTRFKDDLASRMETALGRKISIDGRISFSFFPAPTFSAEAVHLSADDTETNGLAIAVPRLEVRPRLLPLLAGRVEIASLVLLSPEIHLTRWVLGGSAGTGSPSAVTGAPVEGAESGAVSSVVPSAPAAFAQPKTSPIDSVIIENGTLVYQPRGRAPWRFDKLAASFATQTGGGGRLVGAANLGGLDLTFEALQGSALSGQATPVNLSLSTAEGGGTLRFGGQVTGTGDDRRFKGKLSFKAGDFSRIAAALGERGAALSLPLGNVGLTAAVSASAHEVDFDGLSVTLGGVEGTGNAGLTLDRGPQLDVKLGFGRLDLDSLLAGLRGTASTAALGGESVVATQSAPAPAGASPPPSGFHLPADISATVDVSAAVTVFRGGLLKGAHINAALANGEVTLNQASLSLPGNSEVNLFGFFVSPEGVPTFEGSFEAASDDLRGVLDWLKIDSAAVPADRLHAARLAGKLKMRPDEIDLDGTQMRIDGTKIDLAATLRLGERPALGATFAVDTINADAYWPRPKDEGQAVPAGTPADPAVASSGGAIGMVPASWLTRLDANVKGRIGQVVARGMTAQDVAIDGSWVQGLLTLRDVSVGDLAGAQLHIDGGIDGLALGTPAVHALHFAVRSKQPDRLIRQLGLSAPALTERMGAISLSGTLEGGSDSLAIDSHNELAGGLLSFAGKIDQPLMSPRFDGTLEATHASLSQVLRLVAPDYRASGALGALAVTSHASGDSSGLQLTEMKIKAGPVAASGGARLQWTGRARIDAALSAGDIPVTLFLPVTPAAGRPAAPPPAREEPRHGLPAIATDKVSAAPRTSVMTGAIPERWSHEPHDLSWLDSFDGTLKLDAKTLAFTRNHIDGASLTIDVVNGTASLQRLTGQMFGGALTGSGQLANDGGLALQLGLAHAQMRDALLGVADVGVADGVMDADMALSSSGLSSAEWIERLAGSGKFAIRDGVVNGFDLKAVDEHLQGTSGPASLLALLQAGVSGGKTHFSSLAGTIGVANGMVTTDDIRLTADGGGANGSAQINLPASVMDGRVEFHLASAPNAPPLVMRLSGPLDNPRRFVDINGIQQWLASRGMGGKPKDVLKGLLKDLGR